jgi:hypothetical protein
VAGFVEVSPICTAVRPIRGMAASRCGRTLSAGGRRARRYFHGSFGALAAGQGAVSALPFRSAELSADFRLGAGNNGKPLLLLSPAADAAAPSPHERFAVYITGRAARSGR